MSYRPICDVWLLARGAGSVGKPSYYGAYPSGFVRRARDILGSGCIVHLCSGKVSDAGPHLTVDINPNLQPDIVSDARKTPLDSNKHDAVLIDPPYSTEDAKKYGTDYPLPIDLLREAHRIVKPGGKVGLLHFIVPRIPSGFEKRYIALIGVITGSSQKIRVFTVIQKEMM